MRISREVGNPLKARLNNESRSRVRIGSETLPINPLPGGNPGRGEAALSRLLKRLGLQLEKIVGGFARLRSGGKECALILLQGFKPALKVGRMVGPGLKRNSQVSTKEGRAQFRYQFLHGISGVAKAVFEFAV